MMSKTKQALSSLDFAIQNCIVDAQKMPDEFTIAEYIVKSKSRRSTAQYKLELMVSNGLLIKRKIVIDGHLQNLYRKA